MTTESRGTRNGPRGQAEIDANRALAARFDTPGTPAMYIGGKFVAEASACRQMRSMLNELCEHCRIR